jgi:S1-C subfamily serine protease
MNNRVLQIVAVLVAVGLALGLGAIAGGGIVYALTHAGSLLPVAQAQAGDPGYGLVIAAVQTDGPAAKAGVVRGDILLEINGKQLENAGDLTSTLAGLKSGDEVTLTVLHGDARRTLKATLGEQGNRAYLGVTLCGGQPASVTTPTNTVGARIVKVTPDSPAEKAGLQAGDVITAVDGQQVDADHTLADLIGSHKPGDSVTLQVAQEDGASKEIRVTLGQNPDNEGAGYLGVTYSSSRFELPSNGQSPWDNPGNFQFHRMPFVPGGDVQQGAVIRNVVADSPAAAAGLKEGDVITAIDGKAIDSPQAVSDAIAAHQPGDQITLTVQRSGDEQTTDMQVTLGTNPDQAPTQGGGKAYLGVSIGAFFRIQQPDGGQGSGGLEFFGMPFELPFGQDGAPFQFQLPSPPDNNGCNGPACQGKSA